jgi:hypothetical protein
MWQLDHRGPRSRVVEHGSYDSHRSTCDYGPSRKRAERPAVGSGEGAGHEGRGLQARIRHISGNRVMLLSLNSYQVIASCSLSRPVGLARSCLHAKGAEFKAATQDYTTHEHARPGYIRLDSRHTPAAPAMTASAADFATIVFFRCWRDAEAAPQINNSPRPPIRNVL